MKTQVYEYLFPEIYGEDSYDAIMHHDDGQIYLKEVATGDIYQVYEDCLQEVFAELPQGWKLGILMPDGTIGKITRMQ